MASPARSFLQHLQHPLSYHHLSFKESLLILMCVLCSPTFGQADTAIHRYLYPDGSVSSEGPLVDGKPNGHWRAYYENGALKSEGDRKKFQLDSTWSFFAPDGQLTTTITYEEGKKQGPSRKYGASGALLSEDQFKDDLLDGFSTAYFPAGGVQSKVPYKTGKEDGKAYEYAEDGRPITITDWRGGVLQRRLELNRYDKAGLRQGFWQGYWPNGNVQWEGRFTDDKRQGIFKEYDPQGNLKELAKYDQDEVMPDAAETALLDIKNTYYPDGKVASIGSYTKDGKSRACSAVSMMQANPAMPRSTKTMCR